MKKLLAVVGCYSCLWAGLTISCFVLSLIYRECTREGGWRERSFDWWYEVYDWLMHASVACQDWGGATGPWSALDE